VASGGRAFARPAAALMRLPFAAKSKQVQTFNSPATNKVHWNMPDKQLQVPLSTVASFAEHLTEMTASQALTVDLYQSLCASSNRK
jgi:hypothetical protein